MNLNSREPYWIVKTGERCKDSPEIHPHDSSIVGTATSTLAEPARKRGLGVFRVQPKQYYWSRWGFRWLREYANGNDKVLTYLFGPRF